jgi:hypothetical protein
MLIAMVEAGTPDCFANARLKTGLIVMEESGCRRLALAERRPGTARSTTSSASGRTSMRKSRRRAPGTRPTVTGRSRPLWPGSPVSRAGIESSAP